jgi:hypothetical protein
MYNSNYTCSGDSTPPVCFYMYITVSNLIIQSIIDTSINTTGNITRIIDTITSIQMKILISLSIFIILTAVVLGEDEDYGKCGYN